MRKSNWLILAVLAVAAGLFLWLWYYLGFNFVDDPFDLVLAVVWWAVVLVLAGGSPFLLTRNVLYTAITRARELLIVVGNEQTVAKMVQNDRRQKRYSGLRIRLAEGMTHASDS